MLAIGRRIVVGALTLASLSLGMALPASAQSYQQGSNQNLRHVRHHLEFDIRQLQHDQRDYAGLRVRAINDLQAARDHIVMAEQFQHGRPVGDDAGVADNEPGDRGQWGSNRNIRHVRHDVERQIMQLERDARDYGGHKGEAVADLRHARHDLLRAERFAAGRGY